MDIVHSERVEYSPHLCRRIGGGGGGAAVVPMVAGGGGGEVELLVVSTSVTVLKY
jgi:hypothetical protein